MSTDIQTLRDAAGNPVMLSPEAEVKVRTDLQVALTQAPLTPDDWLLTPAEQFLLQHGGGTKELHEKANRHMLAHVFMRSLAPAISR